MAMDGSIPTDFDTMFPNGAYMLGSVSPARDFKRSTREAPVQEVVRGADEKPVNDEQGQAIRVWTVDIVEATDDDSRAETYRVKIASALQPVPPAGLPGAAAVRPVVLEGLQVRPYVNRDRCRAEDGKAHRCGARVAWTLFATGLRSPMDAVQGEPVAAGRNGRGN
jgi:hypothetical protein